MSKTRLEKIDGIKEDIEQLRKRQRTLLKQHNAKERKDRNHRFCRRMGLFETVLSISIINVLPTGKRAVAPRKRSKRRT